MYKIKVWNKNQRQQKPKISSLTNSNMASNKDEIKNPLEIRHPKCQISKQNTECNFLMIFIKMAADFLKFFLFQRHRHQTTRPVGASPRTDLGRMQGPCTRLHLLTQSRHYHPAFPELSESHTTLSTFVRLQRCQDAFLKHRHKIVIEFSSIL